MRLANVIVGRRCNAAHEMDDELSRQERMHQKNLKVDDVRLAAYHLPFTFRLYSCTAIPSGISNLNILGHRRQRG